MSNQMRDRRFARRVGARSGLLGAGVIALAAGLSGCAGDGLELNGKIFDWMGVSESAQAANRREPKVAVRSPLILPPDAKRLPEPGSGQDVDVAAEINDPDRKRVLAAAERERQHKLYCSGELNWKERATKKDGAEIASSPYGPCSAFGNILKQ